MEDQEIADYLKIKRTCISTYIWLASKNGWLTQFNSAKEAIEYGLAHKVIRNLDEGLEDISRNEKTGLMVKTAVALKIAEGTLFKQFGDATESGSTQQTAISIRIEQPREQQPMRPGTIGGSMVMEGDTDE